MERHSRIVEWALRFCRQAAPFLASLFSNIWFGTFGGVFSRTRRHERGERARERAIERQIKRKEARRRRKSEKKKRDNRERAERKQREREKRERRGGGVGLEYSKQPDGAVIDKTISLVQRGSRHNDISSK